MITGLPAIPTRESPVFGTLPAESTLPIEGCALAADIEAYIKRIERRMKENSVKSYAGALRRFERDLRGRLRGRFSQPVLSEWVTADVVAAYLVTLRSRGLSSGTAEQAFHAIMAFLKDRKLYRGLANPIADEEAPRHEESPLPAVFSVEEMKRLCEPIGTRTELRSDALMNVLYGSGLRIAEARMLRWSDLTRVNDSDRIIVRQGKGGKDRIVPATKQSISTLRIWQHFQALGEGDFIFTGRTRLGNAMRSRQTPLTTRQLQKIVNRRSTIVLGKLMFPHQARHGFATHLIEGGAELLAVSEMLGHSNLETTSRYVRVSQKMKRAAASKGSLWER